MDTGPAGAKSTHRREKTGSERPSDGFAEPNRCLAFPDDGGRTRRRRNAERHRNSGEVPGSQSACLLPGGLPPLPARRLRTPRGGKAEAEAAAVTSNSICALQDVETARRLTRAWNRGRCWSALARAVAGELDGEK